MRAWMLRYIYIFVYIYISCHVIMNSSFIAKETDFDELKVSFLTFFSCFILTFEMGQHYTYII